MAKEIEYKFLVDCVPLGWHRKRRYLQGYLPTTDDSGEARVIYTPESTRGDVTIKKRAKTVQEGKPITRDEVMQDIPGELARELILTYCEYLEKTRYYFESGWEIDEYHGALKGLIVAEYEVDSEDDSFPDPPRGLTLVRDVTNDIMYSNKNLAKVASNAQPI